jgi:osmotically-inducible protein OsmY
MVQTLTETEQKIMKAVLDQLSWDARMDAVGVRVEVNGGQVVLDGVVPSYRESRIAEEDALAIPGVRSVMNHLAVQGAPAAAPDDRAIAGNIRNLIRLSSAIDETRISVAVAAGVVVLEGTLDSFWKKARVEALTAEVAGVTSIHNKIAVVPSRNILDEVIAEDITAAIDRDLSLDIERINVEVRNGVVTLGGSVPDRISRRAAEEIAQRTDGVIEISNQLIIDRPQNWPEHD